MGIIASYCDTREAEILRDEKMTSITKTSHLMSAGLPHSFNSEPVILDQDKSIWYSQGQVTSAVFFSNCYGNTEPRTQYYKNGMIESADPVRLLIGHGFPTVSNTITFDNLDGGFRDYRVGTKSISINMLNEKGQLHSYTKQGIKHPSKIKVNNDNVQVKFHDDGKLTAFKKYTVDLPSLRILPTFSPNFFTLLEHKLLDTILIPIELESIIPGMGKNFQKIMLKTF